MMNKWSWAKWKNLILKLLWIIFWGALIISLVKISEATGVSVEEINSWLIAFIAVIVGKATWEDSGEE